MVKQQFMLSVSGVYFGCAYSTVGLCASHQYKETVIGEVHMSRDGGEHRENQTAKHQSEPASEQKRKNISNCILFCVTSPEQLRAETKGFIVLEWKHQSKSSRWTPLKNITESESFQSGIRS